MNAVGLRQCIAWICVVVPTCGPSRRLSCKPHSTYVPPERRRVRPQIETSHSVSCYVRQSSSFEDIRPRMHSRSRTEKHEERTVRPRSLRAMTMARLAITRCVQTLDVHVRPLSVSSRLPGRRAAAASGVGGASARARLNPGQLCDKPRTPLAAVRTAARARSRLLTSLRIPGAR